jgi:hypothetical protein
MISWSVIALLGDLSTLLITKFGVAFGISNLISLGLGICTRITSKKIFEGLKKYVPKDLGMYYYDVKRKKRKEKKKEERTRTRESQVIIEKKKKKKIVSKEKKKRKKKET